MNTTIETAVIPVAGTGAKMLPAASVTAKCLMPLYLEDAAVPVIDFIVEDCIQAGLNQVVFVTTEHGKNELKRYFDADVNDTLLRLFETTGNYDKLYQERNCRRRNNLKFDYVVQRTDRYGTATSLDAVRELVEGEDRIVMTGGDDFIYRVNGVSELKLAIDSVYSVNAQHGIIGVSVSPLEAADRYGVLVEGGSGVLSRISEKPSLDQIDGNPHANVSRYVLSKTIWKYIEAEMSLTRHVREHKFTDVVNTAIEDGERFAIHHAKGEYLDCGEPNGAFKAMNYLRQHPQEN